MMPLTPRESRSSTSGFTLVEMLVALTVAGIALTAGFAALATLQDRTSAATDANVRMLEGATARAMIVDWLSGAVEDNGDLDIQFVGLPAGAELPTAGTRGRRSRAERRQSERLVDQLSASFVTGPPLTDEIYFPTTARTPVDAPISAIRLFVDDDPTTPEVGLVAEIQGRIQDLPMRMELVRQVTGMYISYLPDIDGEVMWSPDWQQRDELPRAVMIVLESYGGEPLPPLLALPIRVALPAAR